MTDIDWKEYYKKNKTQILANRKINYEKNKTQILANQKKYRIANREKINEKKRINGKCDSRKLKRSEKYVCSACHTILCFDHKVRHEKTKKHKANLDLEQ